MTPPCGVLRVPAPGRRVESPDLRVQASPQAQIRGFAVCMFRPMPSVRRARPPHPPYPPRPAAPRRPEGYGRDRPPQTLFGLPSWTPRWLLPPPFDPVTLPFHLTGFSIFLLNKDFHPIEISFFPLNKDFHPIGISIFPLNKDFYPIEISFYILNKNFHPIGISIFPLNKEFHPAIRRPPSCNSPRPSPSRRAPSGHKKSPASVHVHSGHQTEAGDPDPAAAPFTYSAAPVSRSALRRLITSRATRMRNTTISSTSAELAMASVVCRLFGSNRNSTVCRPGSMRMARRI